MNQQPMDRAAADMVARYRRARAYCLAHHTDALKLLDSAYVTQLGRRLGLQTGRNLSATDEEAVLLFDLAIHTAPRGRTRAIDRIQVPADDPAAQASLQAIREARFSIWRVVRRSHSAGLVLRPFDAKDEVCLMDLAMQASMPTGSLFAARLYWPDSFAISCGAVVPLNRNGSIDVLGRLLARSNAGAFSKAQASSLARALYAEAIESGIAQCIGYADVARAA